MSTQRLNQLMKRDKAQYANGSPLILEASALYYDTTTKNRIAQLKWRNIDSRSVKAVKIGLKTYDSFNQMLEQEQFIYDSLLIAEGQVFGVKTPIIIKDDRVNKYEVILKAVSFSDDTIWRSESNDAYSFLPEKKEHKYSSNPPIIIPLINTSFGSFIFLTNK